MRIVAHGIGLFLSLVVIAAALLVSPVQAEENAIIVGVEPAMYDIILEGVHGWNDAGVNFVVQATGCGTGVISFCYSSDPWSWGGSTDWIAWYTPGTSVIYVSTVTPHTFTASTACHELGHWLGLHYHRYEGETCMRDNVPYISPDAIDLQNLGLGS